MTAVMPTVYVSGKANTTATGSEDAVQEVLRRLAEFGILPILDQTTLEGIQKPYLTFRYQNESAAKAMLKAAGEADIFVLIMGGEVYGAIGEFMAYCQAHEPAHIIAYVLGDPDVFRQSIFMCLTGVMVVETVDELIDDIIRLIS